MANVGFPSGLVVKNPPANAGDSGLIPGLGRSPGEGNGSPSNILDWEIPWQRSLVGYSAWCYKEQDMTEHTCMLCYTGRELRERENIFFLNKNLTTQPI